MAKQPFNHNRASIIEIKNLGFQIDDTWIHRNLNLTILKGETLAIVGGSGAGKTLLLKQMLQLETPTTGMIKILGINMKHATQEELNIIRRSWGVMFQQGALFTSLTTLENVVFPLELYTQLEPAIMQELAMLKLKLVGLSEEDAWKYPSELSGGMQKRVAIARACVLDPTLLFLDEPTSGLDPEAAQEFDNLILSLKKGLDLTIVMVTHDVDSLWYAADRIAFLGEGRVLSVGTMEELIDNQQPLIKAYFSGPRGRLAAREYQWKTE